MMGATRLRASMMRLLAVLRERARVQRIGRYARTQIPWTQGYEEFRNAFIAGVMADDRALERFRRGDALPARFGYRLDERTCELPWLAANLAKHDGRLLDAGSALNHPFVLELPLLRRFKTTILTLAPEGAAYFPLGVSYVYDDLRRMGFRDGWFDVVACISTIEHVGMDNSLYASPSQGALPGTGNDFLAAVREMARVLAPGGSLYITFPFGRPERHGWLQQFDATRTDELIAVFAPVRVEESIFKYDGESWQKSDRASCVDCMYFNVHDLSGTADERGPAHAPDFAAAARAVACLRLVKGTGV